MTYKTQIRVLRILFTVSELSGPYNQFSLPFSRSQSIRLVLLSEPGIAVPESIDINHAKGSWVSFISNIMKASLRRFDFIHIHHSNIAILAPLIRLITFGKHRVIMFTLGTCFNNLKPRHKLFLSLSIRSFTYFVCCSDSVRESLPFWFKVIGGQKIKTIRHGINLDRIPLPSPKKKQLVIATRLIKEKNVDLIIKAFKNLNTDYKLLIAGEGAEKANLIAMRDKLGLGDKVEFLGIIPRDSALKLMSESEFYISASNTDGMPIAVLEAISAGCIPILLYSMPHREVGNMGITAFFFEPSPKDIETSLYKAISTNQADRRRIKADNLSIIRTDCGTDTMVRKYIQLVSAHRR